MCIYSVLRAVRQLQSVFQLLFELLQFLSDRWPQRLKLLQLQPANKHTQTHSPGLLCIVVSRHRHISVCFCESPVSRAQVIVDRSLLSDDCQLQIHHLTAEQVQAPPLLLKLCQSLKPETGAQWITHLLIVTTVCSSAFWLEEQALKTKSV